MATMNQENIEVFDEPTKIALFDCTLFIKKLHFIYSIGLSICPYLFQN